MDGAPAALSLPELHRLVTDCRACNLWRDATQSVVGEGPVPAEVMLVGEQPGDREDRTGRPFVGPAGRLLDDALEEARIDRGRVYLTNAVKHFKWKASGKRRLHDKPDRSEVVACRPWLESELQLVMPDVLVLLGATAGQALLGPGFRVTRERGTDLVDTGLASHVVATVHPSALLRVTDGSRRAEARSLFVRDLRTAAELVGW